jgi:hypothetical protein
MSAKMASVFSGIVLPGHANLLIGPVKAVRLSYAPHLFSVNPKSFDEMVSGTATNSLSERIP